MERLIDICDELKQNFVDFSYETNSQRAFPDARDGLKPGQRACLWEMYERKYFSNKPHVKSAKISGGVIANWWPHGNVAIYDTFTRMSQSWINNIPEVDFHGNNGNIVIGSAAASERYTEARLSKATEEGLFNGIKKKVVPMIPNFSEDDEWPEVLPAIMPRLLLNGSQGIGMTIANHWLNYNLQEVADNIINYIKTGEIDYEMAPDFPTGGIIVNKNDLSKINKTGKGKAIVRAKAEIKGNKILITELPYQVYVEELIEKIKKSIDKGDLKTIKDIYNKTDKKRLLIEIDCEANTAPSTLQKLFALTDLQKNYNANQYALVSKTPKLLTLKDYFDIYIEHNLNCIANEYEFDLLKAEKRKEIVEGLIKALEDIENIINLIKQSKSAADAKENLIKKYNFSEPQAKAIVDMKLGRLANLEQIALQDELKELIQTCEDCEIMLTEDSKQKEALIDRLTKFTKKYGTPRKTEVTNMSLPSDKEIATVVPEDCVVVVSQSGLIKRVPKTTFKKQRRNGKGVQNKDGAILTSISTNTVDTLMIFTNKGKMYRLLVDAVPTGTNRTKGVDIATLVALEGDEKLIAVTSLHRKSDAEYVVFATKKGYIKKTLLSEYLKTKKKTGIVAIKLEEDDSIATVTFLNQEEVLLLTYQGMCIRFKTDNINAIGRNSRGVKGIKLNAEDYVITMLPIKHLTDKIGVFTVKGYGKMVELENISCQGRGGKGVMINRKDSAAGYLVGGLMLNKDDTILLTGTPNNICISAEELPTSNRTSLGNILIKDSKINSVIKI